MYVMYIYTYVYIYAHTNIYVCIPSQIPVVELITVIRLVVSDLRT